jgi:hypothetical protein
MDDYGLSPMSMLRIMSPILVIGPIVLWFLVTGPFVLYLVARWRANRDPVGDPHLGLKIAFHYFGLLGAQFALAGGLLLVWSMLGKWSSDERGEVLRSAFAMLVPGVIVYATHVALLRRTNDDRATIARRLFQGYNLLLVGLVGFTGFVLVFHALFMKGSSGEFGRFAASLLIVYGAAWGFCGVRFTKLVLESNPPDSGAPPREIGPAVPMPVQQQPSQPSPPSGPSLPPLGGGSFPPIESK